MDRIVPARMTTRLEYAVAKLAGEAAVLNSPARARVVRPFNVAGPRQSSKGGFVVPRFIEQATKNEPITVFGTGTQIRAFTHVRDIAQGLIKGDQPFQRLWLGDVGATTQGRLNLGLGDL